KNLMPGISFQISYTTQTDQPLSLFSIIEKTGGLPCATSDELQIAQHQPEANLFADTATPMVFGGPTTTTALTTEPTGTYLICSWLEGPNPGEVDSGPLTTAITVGTPTPPPAPRPRLSLRRVAASARHGAHLSGTAARRFGGPVQVTVACGSSRAHRRTAVRHGRFSVRLRLPRGCTAGRRATVTVSWSGSAAWANQSVTRSVTVRR
ncbi:MAG: hypothetical protein ACRDMJ_05015, partial [Solirubrobacteraceae bacterium]